VFVIVVVVGDDVYANTLILCAIVTSLHNCVCIDVIITNNNNNNKHYMLSLVSNIVYSTIQSYEIRLEFI